jgi:hypothetical protein
MTTTKLLPQEMYLENKRRWAQHIVKREPSSAWLHLAYCLLTNRSVERAFRPLSSERKIKLHAVQGQNIYYKLKLAYDKLYTALQHLERAIKRNPNEPVQLVHAYYVRMPIDPRTGNPVYHRYDEVIFNLTAEAVPVLQGRLKQVEGLLTAQS